MPILTHSACNDHTEQRSLITWFFNQVIKVLVTRRKLTSLKSTWDEISQSFRWTMFNCKHQRYICACIYKYTSTVTLHEICISVRGSERINQITRRAFQQAGKACIPYREGLLRRKWQQSRRSKWVSVHRYCRIVNVMCSIVKTERCHCFQQIGMRIVRYCLS